MNFQVELTTDRRCWLRELDRHPGELEQWLAQRPTSRLGIRFERLWAFFFQQDPQYRLIATNLPIRAGGTTLGEFDVLVEDLEKNQHLHLELTLKYYLQIQDPTADPSHSIQWLGPDGVDTLQRKLSHLLSRQLQLGYHEQAQFELEQLGVKELKRGLLLRGWLFRSLKQELALPQNLHDQNQIHQWQTFSDFSQVYEGQLSRGEPVWHLLERSEWITASPNNTPPFDAQRERLLPALLDALEKTDRPQMLAALPADSKNRLPGQRLFVTPDDWPPPAT